MSLFNDNDDTSDSIQKRCRPRILPPLGIFPYLGSPVLALMEQDLAYRFGIIITTNCITDYKHKCKTERNITMATKGTIISKHATKI